MNSSLNTYLKPSSVLEYCVMQKEGKSAAWYVGLVLALTMKTNKW